MDTTQIGLNIAYALLILVAGSFLGSWLRGMVQHALERTRLDPIVRRLIVSIVRPIILVIAAVAALQQLGVAVTTPAAMLGAVTLAIGMSLQGSLSNVASGTLLLTFRPFNVGDFITAGGVSGSVHALKLFSTTLHTPDGLTVTLPNDAVWRAPITNFSDRPTRRIRLVFVVPHGTKLDTAEQALRDVVAAEARVLAEPAASVTFPEATDLGQPVVLMAHVTNADYGATLSALQRGGYDALQAKKITLASRAG